MKALVTGGYFDRSGEGVVWELDLATERAEVVLRWTPPPHLRVPTKGFAGGCLARETLYVAAHAAVVRIERGEVSGVLHQPCMNDLHHVAHMDGRLWVANTGLSAVDVFDEEGGFQGSHALLPAWANARRLRGQDPPSPPVSAGWSGEGPPAWPAQSTDDGYLTPDRAARPFHQQKVPDYLHVNHVTRWRGRVLATCFADGTLRDLTDYSVATRLPGAYLHDGVPEGDSLWLTAIDGRVLRLGPGLHVEDTHHLFETGHFGWCRGLAVTKQHLLAGLTEVRRDRLPRHRWADRDPEGSETSVLLLDRTDGRLLARVDLTDRHRHSKLYSILPLPETS